MTGRGFGMDCIKKPLLVTVFIVSIGCAQSMTETEEGAFFKISVEKNKETLLDTNQCVQCGLQGVDLAGASLRQAVLTGSNLAGANLSGADLTVANLEGANLNGADLTGAILKNANLFGANLKDAILTNSVVQDANFRGAEGLTPEQKGYLKENGASVY